ncbi:MAG: hypothetical protein JNJ45_01175 [Chthonomonas sp.]|nr:hypothetical protein [Chthonomonas sp.]
MIGLAWVLLAGSNLEFTTGYAALTPPEPLPLGGYTERKGANLQPGGEELGVRVLGLRQGRTMFVASCDLLTIPESLRAAVAERLPAGTTLFLHATHTHCAPDSQMLNDRMTIPIPGIATFRKRWMTWYAERIAASILAADKGWQPVRSAEVLTWRMARNRGRRKFAQPDTLATMIQLNGRNIWFNYAAHPVNYDPTELQTRRDWPSAVDAQIISQGALGDVSPAMPGPTPEARIQQFRRDVRGGLARASRAPLDLKFDIFDQPYDCAKPQPHKNFAKEYGVTPELAQTVVNRFAPPQGRITGFRLGKLAVIGVGGEPSAELGRQIARQGRVLGFTWTLPVAHVNGWIGYVLSPEDYDRGGYEANLQLHGRDSGTQMVERVAQALNALAHPPARR